MLHGDAQGYSASVCPPCRLDVGPLMHLAASRKGATLLAGGHQALVTLELTSRSGESDDYPVMCLEKRRNLTARSRLARCTGVAFQPESDSVAASCWANGQICLWDTVSRHPEPLLRKP
eukprot:gb/GFBE01045667.1/.p1 GENE.gb/GFBE01045667.1/~~gb/GFBE01045667.1/.p1  ORF type:complete len:119 (+),score=12.67 gb/GFBE01045667.1/:1-357(+)